MQNLLDGNTAALNAYELQQEKRYLAAEIDEDDIDMRVEDLMVSEIESCSELAIEAIGTEATLISGNEFHAKFKQTLLDSIKCKGSKSQDSADKDLGKLLRELVTAHIVSSTEDLI